jgi:6-phosphogluconolactonase (cycloisomerase 2 family)
VALLNDSEETSMRHTNWLRGALAAGVAAAALPLSSDIVAHAATIDGVGSAVFVQTNAPGGNSIAAYDRSQDGTLSLDATYPTGGDGGRAAGSSSDPLASQGSLVFEADRSLLFGVNAGSNSVSVFGVRGDGLELRQVIASGGSFPTSIAVHGGVLYVLNAGGSVNVSGFAIDGGRLRALRGGTRSLGLTESDPPAFLQSPAEVGFTPDGRQLIVTGKTNNFIDVFAVGDDDRLAASPIQTPDGSVPFAFAFSPSGQLDLVNAAGNLAPSVVDHNGTITPAGTPVANGQTASCWIALARDFAYVANTGSNDVSGYHISDNGTVTLVNATAATGISGATDETTAGGGRFLYVQVGLGSSVNAYAVNGDGSLTLLQAAAVPGGSNQEGIAST